MTKPLTAEEQDQLESAMSDAQPDGQRKTLRRRLFAMLAGGVALIGAGAYAYGALILSDRVTTDNAYVAADSAQIAALVAGPVADIRAVDTQYVRKGDILVVLDDTDRRLDLEQAEAALGHALRKVRAYHATDDALDGQIAARKADLARAQTELARTATEYRRRQPLASTGAISGEELTSARTAYDSAQAAADQAQANLRAAYGSREANHVLVSGVPVEENPEVAAARLRVDQARVNLARTIIRAPIDGLVAKRTVQVGQMVQPGSALMTIVPVQQAYVNANFKEGQLRQVRIGQPAELESDLYGGKVVYHGKVVGLSGGTGAAFAVIPAQNATGNWIKVVQRLPVRIAIDPADLAAHPLKVGLSMQAVIHTDRGDRQ